MTNTFKNQARTAAAAALIADENAGKARNTLAYHTALAVREGDTETVAWLKTESATGESLHTLRDAISKGRAVGESKLQFDENSTISSLYTKVQKAKKKAAEKSAVQKTADSIEAACDSVAARQALRESLNMTEKQFGKLSNDEIRQKMTVSFAQAEKAAAAKNQAEKVAEVFAAISPEILAAVLFDADAGRAMNLLAAMEKLRQKALAEQKAA